MTSKTSDPPATPVAKPKIAPSASDKTSGAQARDTRQTMSAGKSRRLQQKRREQWQRRAPILATIGVVLVAILTFVILSRGQSTPNVNLASASLVNEVTAIPTNIITTVGTGGVTNPLVTVKKPQTLTGTGGKPEFLYIGAEYCPFCAAERWSMIVALSHFGTFANLHTAQSSLTDTYPGTNTFTFYQSTYASQYIDFVPVETTTIDPSTPLQTPTAQQSLLLNTYDSTTYFPSTEAGGIPFIDIANSYIEVSSGYSPQDLAGLTWQQIAGNLSNAYSQVTKDIVGNANYLTAAICLTLTKGPAICQTPAIQTIMTTLKNG